VVKVATPPLRVPVPIELAPSRKVTVPVGVPAPGATGETVAVNLTDCPKTEGFTDEATVVEVGAGLTAWLRVPELPLKPPSVFVYTALMVCGEPLTVRVAVAPLVAVTAVPDPDSGTTPPNGAPSTENWTEPVGVAVSPEVLATVAVKVTDCPKIDGFTEEVTVVEVVQVGVADAVLDATLSWGGFVFKSTAVTKYE
jgi:hypothetical protein